MANQAAETTVYRSLIALSLIMSLLQFKPAPMYILDEVDAALDLSHTQHIGHLFRTRFHGSQFIVVSLKEGLVSGCPLSLRAPLNAQCSSQMPTCSSVRGSVTALRSGRVP